MCKPTPAGAKAGLAKPKPVAASASTSAKLGL